MHRVDETRAHAVTTPILSPQLAPIRLVLDHATVTPHIAVIDIMVIWNRDRWQPSGQAGEGHAPAQPLALIVEQGLMQRPGNRGAQIPFVDLVSSKKEQVGLGSADGRHQVIVRKPKPRIVPGQITGIRFHAGQSSQHQGLLGVRIGSYIQGIGSGHPVDGPHNRQMSGTRGIPVGYAEVDGERILLPVRVVQDTVAILV